MFKDYYAILEIELPSTKEDIKAAFKKQALRWHPDRNTFQDTNSKMQDINEAKLILLDVDARERYNTEYNKFKDYQNQKYNENRQREKQDEKQKTNEQKQYQETQSQAKEYVVEDEILNKWMNNAKKQAVDLAKETIKDLKGMTKQGMKAASEKVKSQIPFLLIMAGIFLIIALLTKTSNNQNSKNKKHFNDNFSTTINSEKNTYQTFTNAGFKVKCDCKLNVNTELIQLANQQVTNNIIAAYICAESLSNPDLSVANSIVIKDESERYNNIQPSDYSTIEKEYIDQYATNLNNKGISYIVTTYQGVSAIETTFEELGMPFKAIIFLKEKKLYLLQVGTRKNLTTKFSSLKSSFVTL